MSKEHDSWLKGLGVDVAALLGRAAGAGASAASHAPPDKGSLAAAAGDQKRYDIKLGRHDLKAATMVDAIRALTAEHQQLRGNCNAEMQAHGERMQRGAESLGVAAVALISETLGGAQMPPLEIWDPAFEALDRSKVAMRGLSVEQAVEALTQAQEAYHKARAAVVAYDGDLEAGGDRAVTSLKVTAAAGAVAAGVATGGAATAAGLGVAGTASVGAASAGAYGVAQELAGQGSEVYFADTRREIDWGAVLRRGANDAALGLIGGLVGGALTKQFSKLFGSYLGKAITEAELIELGKALGMAGPLERNFFMTAGQKLMAEFLSSAALAPAQAAITLAINRVSGGAPGPKDMEAFMEGVAGEIVQGGVFQLLVAFLVHKMPPAPRARSGQPAAAPQVTEPQAAAELKPGPSSGAPVTHEPVAEPVLRSEPSTKPTAKPPEQPTATEPLKGWMTEEAPMAANDNAELPPANDNVVPLPKPQVQELPLKMAAGAEKMSAGTQKPPAGNWLRVVASGADDGGKSGGSSKRTPDNSTGILTSTGPAASGRFGTKEPLKPAPATSNADAPAAAKSGPAGQAEQPAKAALPEAQKAPEAEAGGPMVGGGTGGGGMMAEPPLELGKIKLDKQRQHTYALAKSNENAGTAKQLKQMPKIGENAGAAKQQKKEDLRVMEGTGDPNPRINKILKTMNGKSPGASLFNEYYDSPAMQEVIRVKVQAELDAGRGTVLPGGGRQLTLDRGEPTGWVVDKDLNGIPTNKLRVDIAKDGQWHYFPVN